jgi:hypothetical protein
MNLIFLKKINYFWQYLLIINIIWYIKIHVKNLWEFVCMFFFFDKKSFKSWTKKLVNFF